MANVVIKVSNNNGTWVQAPGSNAGYVTTPGGVPTIATQIINFGSLFNSYSNTSLMLANDATTYANAVNYTINAVANVYVSNLVDVYLPTVPPANNSTLVYNSANNKYIVQQLNLDGGSF